MKNWCSKIEITILLIVDDNPKIFGCDKEI